MTFVVVHVAVIRTHPKETIDETAVIETHRQTAAHHRIAGLRLFAHPRNCFTLHGFVGNFGLHREPRAEHFWQHDEIDATANCRHRCSQRATIRGGIVPGEFLLHQCNGQRLHRISAARASVASSFAKQKRSRVDSGAVA